MYICIYIYIHIYVLVCVVSDCPATDLRFEVAQPIQGLEYIVYFRLTGARANNMTVIEMERTFGVDMVYGCCERVGSLAANVVCYVIASHAQDEMNEALLRAVNSSGLGMFLTCGRLPPHRRLQPDSSSNPAEESPGEEEEGTLWLRIALGGRWKWGSEETAVASFSASGNTVPSSLQLWTTLQRCAEVAMRFHCRFVPKCKCGF